MTIQCNVEQISTLATDVYKVVLNPKQDFNFKAGQYLTVVMGDKDHRAFSIASNPFADDKKIELHIGAPADNSYAGQVMDACRQALNSGGEIEIDGPHGDAHWQQDSTRPMLLVAGGTGFSYAYSMLMATISQKITTPIYFYWGTRNQEQLYALAELEQAIKPHAHIKLVTVVEQAQDNWAGKIGNVVQAVTEDFASLADLDIYVAGRFEMAKVAREQFTENKDAKLEHLFGDAYAFI